MVKGLIPARAGSTFNQVLFFRLRWAHPRPCGEHGSERGLLVWKPGSSPPVRGAQGAACGYGTQDGLIPARAGSTDPPHWHQRSPWAHPRPCGEHPLQKGSLAPLEGSSPPVRGAP